MKEEDLKHLEEWIGKFSGTALLGYLCCLLLCGKAIHHIVQRRGLVFGLFIVPSCILSGVMGLFFCYGMHSLNSEATGALINGLSITRRNLLNFMFAALVLGLSCKRTSSQHHSAGIKGILASLFHEGMPMLIYSQILGWGQSALCLFVVFVLNISGSNVPYVFAAMVPLGLEAGTDISTTLNIAHDDWSLDVIEEAESLGLIITSVLFIFIYSAKPYILSWNNLTYSDEAFSNLQRRDSITNLQNSSHVEAFAERSSLKGSLLQRGEKNASIFTRMLEDDESSADEGGYKSQGYKPDRLNDRKNDKASLGTHLSILVLTVFFSFLISLSIRIVEIWFALENKLFSSLRMFKLAMFCALFGMYFLQRQTRVVFQREWFMRISGLMLDLIVIASFTVASPLPETGITSKYYGVIVLLVLVCVGWNLFCFLYLSPRLFPNYWFERALTLSGDSLGHSFLGLLFARTLDPVLESPVPFAYAYKLMLFFIPSSGEKNGVILTLLDSSGVTIAFLVSVNIAIIWLVICEKYFSNRFVTSKLNAHRNMCINDFEVSYTSNGNRDAEENQRVPEVRIIQEGDMKSLGSAKSINNNSSAQLMPAILPSNPSSTVSIRRNESVSKLATVLLPPELEPTMIPTLENDCLATFLTHSQLGRINSWLPEHYHTKAWSLKYSLRRDGASTETLLNMCGASEFGTSSSHASCIIVIEDSWGYIFGGFIAPALRNKTSYYGNGESLVFSLLPEPRVYKWSGKNEFFALSNFNTLAMGGGGGGYAFHLDDELNDGISSCSDTFENAMLSSNQYFKCLNVEVWVLDKMSFSV